jgi:lipooligosaccharide transport system ATP-binding protein
LAPDSARVEPAEESMRVYASDYEVLRAVADGLPPGDHHLRPTTLEDVFLKATGRRLDARQ